MCGLWWLFEGLKGLQTLSRFALVSMHQHLLFLPVRMSRRTMSKLAAQLPRHLHKTTQDPKLTKTTFKAII